MRKVLILAALSAGVFTSCVDDAYNLDDIDTTVQVQVKDLVVPITLQPITLSYMLDLDPDGKVHEVDGVYSVVVCGNFNSSDIIVNPVEIAKPAETPKANTSIALPTIPPLPDVKEYIAGIDLTIGQENNLSTDFAYSTPSASKSIRSIAKVGVDWTVGIDLASKLGTDDIITKMKFSNIDITLPKGLELDGNPVITGGSTAGEAKYADGKLTIDSYVSNGSKINISMKIKAIDAAKAGIVVTPGTDYTQIAFAQTIGVNSATLNILDYDESKTIAGSLDINLAANLSTLKINTFSGDISYDISNLNVPAVNLDDLPDVLTQSNTNVLLANPQIYLGIENPLAKYGLEAQTGITMTPMRSSVKGTTISPDNGRITIGCTTPYNIVMAPDTQAALANPYPGYGTDKAYTDLNTVKFTGLSHLLEGDGLPTKIEVALENPSVNSYVSDFVLGSQGKVSGRYTFFAPLQFLAGTKVEYTDTESGWADDDLQKLTVNNLEVHANVYSDLPLGVELTATPLDSHGNPISATITATKVKANASGEELVISMTGTIKDLDGIKFTAKADAADGKPLSPSMNVRLENVKAKVSGYYTTEL